MQSTRFQDASLAAARRQRVVAAMLRAALRSPLCAAPLCIQRTIQHNLLAASQDESTELR